MRARFEIVEQLFELEKDPAKRVDLQARLGQEKIKLAHVAERPEWAAPDAAGEADRPVAEARRALLATGAGRDDAGEADQAALSAFEIAGMNPETALERVRYEKPVDQATAQSWRAEEVAQSAQARSTGEVEAVQDVERAYQIAFAAYDNAAKRVRQAAPNNVPGNAEEVPTVEETAKRSRGMKL